MIGCVLAMALLAFFLKIRHGIQSPHKAPVGSGFRVFRAPVHQGHLVLHIIGLSYYYYYYCYYHYYYSCSCYDDDDYYYYSCDYYHYHYH